MRLSIALSIGHECFYSVKCLSILLIHFSILAIALFYLDTPTLEMRVCIKKDVKYTKSHNKLEEELKLGLN